MEKIICISPVPHIVTITKQSTNERFPKYFTFFSLPFEIQILQGMPRKFALLRLENASSPKKGCNNPFASIQTVLGHWLILLIRV